MVHRSYTKMIPSEFTSYFRSRNHPKTMKGKQSIPRFDTYKKREGKTKKKKKKKNMYENIPPRH